MNIAYLIAVHDQPDYLTKLVQALNCSWAHFFIHVDRKADVAIFRRVVPTSANVTFVPEPERVAVYWGGFSQVQASLNLIKAAYTAEISFTRYCLLSGADFPLKSQDRIRQVLSTSTEFISIDRKLEKGTVPKSSLTKNIQRFYWRDRPNALQRLAAGLIPRRDSPLLPVYHGSQWWILTDGCIAFIQDFLADRPSYADFFKHTNCPVEMFFHSIVKASPFSASISQDFERMAGSAIALPSPNVYGAHYIDWSTRARSPKTLDLSDLDALNQSQALFARKFMKGSSDGLTRALVKHSEQTLSVL